MDDILQKERRRRLIKKIIGYTLAIIISIIITPYILLVAGLVIMIIGAFSMSPTINLLRFRRRHIFSSFELEEEDMEEEEKIMNISWKGCLILFAIGLALFILTLVILSLGWNGLIFLL